MVKNQEKHGEYCGWNVCPFAHTSLLLLPVIPRITNKEEGYDKRFTRSESVKGVSAFILGTQWPDSCLRKRRSCGKQQ